MSLPPRWPGGKGNSKMPNPVLTLPFSSGSKISTGNFENALRRASKVCLKMDSLRKSLERCSMSNSSNPSFELEESFNLSSLIETLEVESALLKRAIRKNFESLRLKMSTTAEIFSKNLDLSTRGALAFVENEVMIARNQFLFESILRKFEETSLEMGEIAKKVASNNFEGILKKISIHNNRMKQKFTPRRCPQGSVLAPILWNIYFNPVLGLNSNKFLIQAFADDLAVVTTGRVRRTLEIETYSILDQICNKLKNLKLVISPVSE
ncbi:uncharacterized protein TNCV_4329781 [Trichonephila clavipes]|nr:uncharacterized protein TNCV_4329781 [Trichonephila clavipes]